MWLGAPAGIEADFREVGDMLPVIDPDATVAPEDLDTVLEEFKNHGRVDQDPEAVAFIDEYVERGWLKEFPTAESLAAYVEGKPILNMFACLDRERWDPTAQQFVTKRRLIMDSKRSLVRRRR